ncbi:phytochrome-like protein [Desulfocucumis palustris]|uniref:Stage 0 sporulation protein A homolog n=1 Tax=Desulfocucumis palustris TaxID=1898651 RepID=A0A2L2X938_9FIRM|nr:diguanylate cyclase [Desulfocucumis palustris]GBF32103.1 phytochrome-like protein [Desulfocucumis palustris]
MAILTVDDSPTTCSIIGSYLEGFGQKLFFTGTGHETIKFLGITSFGAPSETVDLILLDIVLPDMDGRDVCRIIKNSEHLKDIPVIIITSLLEMEHLEKAFEAGATDYINKPVHKIELLARIRSALKLKFEMDKRKVRERSLIEVTLQLEEAIKQLNLLSTLDGLTGIANRRRFDEYIDLEWRRGIRNVKPLSLIMADIDYFKNYNDLYGHLAGDECLKTVARALQGVMNRPGDLLCRYGGEEFVAVLPGTPKNGSLLMAEKMSAVVKNAKIVNKSSKVDDYVTVSMGVATALPTREALPAVLIAEADKALYEAKQAGRNTVRAAGG